MRVSINKLTGKMIESQSGGDDIPELMEERLDTLKQNAINAGYAEADIEVKFVTDEEYAVILAIKTPEEAAIEQQAKATVAIQSMLDTKCLEYEFDNINNATGWAPYYPAAMALTLWGKACWDKSTEIRADVLAGTRPMPTVEEVLSEMPVFTWPE